MSSNYNLTQRVKFVWRLLRINYEIAEKFRHRNQIGGVDSIFWFFHTNNTTCRRIFSYYTKCEKAKCAVRQGPSWQRDS